jgi:SAM-dependent methyltransferase
MFGVPETFTKGRICSLSIKTYKRRDLGLYGYRDPLGLLLSEWRNRAVIPYIKNGKFLDLACGDNRLVRWLGYGEGLDIFDFGADRIEANFTDLKYSDSSIDTITIVAALNYFDDPKGTIVEIDRILKPGGNLVITFLNKKISNVWHKFIDRKLPRVAFDRSELLSLLSDTNLALKETHSFKLGVNHVYVIEKNQSVCR